MFNWLVFLHIFFAFLFMLAHGVHAAAMLKFRGEADPERSLSFFNVVPQPTPIRWLAVLLGLPAFLAAYLAGWLAHGWVWASLVVFVIISGVLFRYGAGYYSIIEGAATGLIEATKTKSNIDAAREAYDAARNAPYAIILPVVGISGLAIMLWLMRFKPF